FWSVIEMFSGKFKTMEVPTLCQPWHKLLPITHADLHYEPPQPPHPPPPQPPPPHPPPPQELPPQLLEPQPPLAPSVRATKKSAPTHIIMNRKAHLCSPCAVPTR